MLSQVHRCRKDNCTAGSTMRDRRVNIAVASQVRHFTDDRSPPNPRRGTGHKSAQMDRLLEKGPYVTDSEGPRVSRSRTLSCARCGARHR